MSSDSRLGARVTALVASVLIGLASGTTYLYGVYSPQLIQKCRLKASDSATLSLAVNLGTAIGGLVGGVVIDHLGTTRSIVLGSVSIFVGYLGLYFVYIREVSSIGWLCFAILFVGFGCVTSFFTILKATQANFPKHRGSAGALPVSAYGLSATLYSVVAASVFKDDVGGLLLFVAVASGGTVFVSSFFVDIHLEHEDHDDERPPLEHANSSTSVSSADFESSTPRRVNSSSSLNSEASLPASLSFWGIGERTPRGSMSSLSEATPLLRELVHKDSSSSLRQPVNQKSGGSVARKAQEIKKSRKHKTTSQVFQKLLTSRLFLTHITFVALISGISSMYIYSIGFIVNAQYYYNAPSVGIAPNQLQALQVSVISIASFSGRLLSGLASDFIYKKFHIQRLWIVLATTFLVCANQFLCIVNVHSAHMVTLTSAIAGGAYGLTFGVYPAVIADEFGTRNFSISWGLICFPPFIVLYLLTKYFGRTYDQNTDAATGICYKGNGCYKEAFELSFGLSFLLIAVCILLIYLHRNKR